MDNADYEKYLKEQAADYESLCKRCGECCGADNDPCANLVMEGPAKYVCRVYDQRLGSQKTVSGKSFTCVPIRDNINRGFSNPKCLYVM